MSVPPDQEGFSSFLALLERKAPRPLTIQEMARMLEVDDYDRRELKAALETKVTERALRRVGKTRYQWVRESERKPAAAVRAARTPLPAGRQVSGPRVEGHYARVRAGYGFVEVLGRDADRYRRDILIPAGFEGAALHGDRVAVEIVRRDPRLRRIVGRVVAVPGPVHETVIGTLECDRFGWRLLPEDELLPTIDLVGTQFPTRDQAGLVAKAQITRPATAKRGPGAELIEVVGSVDNPEVQFLIIASEHGLRVDFPAAVVAEAEALPSDPDASDLENRIDLSAQPFVTIDGETARDFDDAVCLQTLGDGGYRLWVAIADVSHYVCPGSALDREAARRGTSVYFPDRAIPMLPPALSSELCSLKPQRPRLVLVAELDYDGGGRRVRSSFYRAVIRSHGRLTYTQVAAVLSRTDSAEIRAWRHELDPLLPQLRLMQQLMTILYRNRVGAGSLDLDLPEALVDLSEEGRSIAVRLGQRNDAHRLIEELMLEANRAVAMHLREHDVPLPYRIHEAPDALDVDELNESLQVFGFHVDYRDQVRSQDVQRLLNQLEGHRMARVLTRLALRSLKQAQYRTVNAGHFGLAFPIYCHFTSPIRRYPDLLVHRQLTLLLDGEIEAAQSRADALESASVASSQSEREAMAAERAMLDLKKAEFMLEHLLEPETGTIVTVISAGFFVELDAYPIEGLVRADSLADDRYYFIEDEHALKGMRTQQRFRLGDRVVVEAVEVSLRRRQIDFVLVKRLPTEVADGSEPKQRQRRGKAPKKREREQPARPPKKNGRKNRPHAAKRRGRK